MTIFRLNYAIDLKYGVVSELARTILDDEAIDLTMGHVNVIWQKMLVSKPFAHYL